jgi:hypothetical protein
LFFSNPPITRVVLDLAEPQSYQISTTTNGIVVKLNPVKLNSGKLNPVKLSPAQLSAAKPAPANLNSSQPSPVAPSSATAARAQTLEAPPAARLVPAVILAPAAKLTNASLATGARVATAKVAPAVSVTMAAPLLAPVSEELPPPKPLVSVTYANGVLRIRADRATLAQVLFEVQRQTQADIAIPAGAEQEEVVADLGPAPARDVLGALLNGSQYNFIFIGNEASLERVILTRRDPNIF